MSRSRPTSRSTASRTPWAVPLRVAGLAAVAVALVVLAFVWPTRSSSVKDLPVDVVGQTPLSQAARGSLSAAGPFVVGSADSRDAAVSRIQTRQSYAAIVPPSAPGQPVEVLTATAASPVVAQLVQGLAGQIERQLATQAPAGAAPKVVVTDLVPLAAADARGAGLAVAALPLAMGGMIGGVLVAMLVAGVRRRLVAVLGYAASAGVLVAVILGPWLGVLPEFWPSAAVFAVALLATGATIVGLHALLGRPGIALGALLTLFVGNPLSSAAAPVEFLPAPWGAVGQTLVPGASSTLLRLVNYFPQADPAGPWIVLGVWLVVGLVLSVTGRHRNEEVVHLPESQIA